MSVRWQVAPRLATRAGLLALAAIAPAVSPWIGACAVLALAVPLSWLDADGATSPAEEAVAPSVDPLSREVAHRVSVLPVLSAQLRDTATQVEHSVGEVCESFQGMATEARQVVAQATSGLQGDEGDRSANLRILTSSARDTLRSVVERTVSNSRFSMQMIYKMEDVEAGISEVEKTVASVPRIAPRPVCWRSTPRSRRRAPARRGAASPWWRARSPSSPTRPAPRAAASPTWCGA